MLKPAESARRPLDTYDPSAEGLEPYPLAETLDSLRGLLASFTAVEAALRGCMTPLNLKKTALVLNQTKAELTHAADELAVVAEIIETDQPIAKAFRYWEARWTDLQNRILSPTQLVLLRDLASQAPPEERTTYRREHEGRAEVPTLASMWVKQPGVAEPVRTARKVQSTLHRSLLDDMLSRPCSKCSSVAGMACVTTSGAIAERPHAGRRDASPLMVGNIHLYQEIEQPFGAIHGDYYWMDSDGMSSNRFG